MNPEHYGPRNKMTICSAGISQETICASLLQGFVMGNFYMDTGVMCNENSQRKITSYLT
jgi:hypothetical protein